MSLGRLTTDILRTDKEAVYVLHFDPSPDKKLLFWGECQLFWIENRYYAWLDSLTIVIGKTKEQMKNEDIKCKDPYSKLVGFGAHGASVNRDKKESAKTLLLEKWPCLFFCW